MGATGLQPPTLKGTRDNDLRTPGDSGAAKSCALPAMLPTVAPAVKAAAGKDSDLAAVIAAWPNLSAADRERVVTIIRQGTQGGRKGGA